LLVFSVSAEAASQPAKKVSARALRRTGPRESYYPLLPSDIPWIHAGYSEFPPELGNESKYSHVRDY